jgi:biotin synthase
VDIAGGGTAESPPLAPFQGAVTVADILAVLRQPRPRLFAWADQVRLQHVGDEVFLRGIVEISNICANDCLYCGIRRSNRAVHRYRLGEQEIVAIARRMQRWRQTTIVLQSGELPRQEDDRNFGDLLQRIKAETGLAITVSAGNRSRDVYRYWRDCGMDRYLLRFETSDADLFGRLHPDCSLAERLHCLNDLRELDVQVGSGFMIGVPGETVELLAANILLCRALDLDMIGIGPFIAHPDTPLAGAPNAYDSDPEMFFVAVATLRIFNPDAHIPSTTAFDAVFPGVGRNLALERGANVFMPSNTPAAYRKDYLLYPNKPCVDETSDKCSRCVAARIWALGRLVGEGPGHSFKRRAQTHEPADACAGA